MLGPRGRRSFDPARSTGRVCFPSPTRCWWHTIRTASCSWSSDHPMVSSAGSGSFRRSRSGRRTSHLRIPHLLRVNSVEGPRSTNDAAPAWRILGSSLPRERTVSASCRRSATPSPISRWCTVRCWWPAPDQGRWNRPVRTGPSRGRCRGGPVGGGPRGYRVLGCGLGGRLGGLGRRHRRLPDDRSRVSVRRATGDQGRRQESRCSCS